MSITGDADGPPYRLGVAIADLVSGMFAAQGVALALLARARTGRGQHVDVAMLDSVAALLTYQAGLLFTTSRAPGRLGNRHPMIAPYETFEASDAYASELEYFADCITRDSAPEPSGVEGLQDVRIVEAIYRSARDGRPVTLPRLARVETPPTEQDARKVADRRQAS